MYNLHIHTNIYEIFLHIHTYIMYIQKYSSAPKTLLMKNVLESCYTYIYIYTYLYTISIFYIIIRYWVCLFVRYRNHLPVVQFQNQAQIRNPHGTTEVFKTIWGRRWRPLKGAPIGTRIIFLTPLKAVDSAVPNFIYFFILLPPPKAVVSRMGAEGAAPSEGEGNPAEGGCFASIYRYEYILKNI